MSSASDNLSFGDRIKQLRKGKGWTVKEFIAEIKALGQENISPAYVTRIELYGEIPSPELICRMADVFGINEDELLKLARENKVKQLSKSLEEKYQKAAGIYRKERKKKF